MDLNFRQMFSKLLEKARRTSKEDWEIKYSTQNKCFKAVQQATGKQKRLRGITKMLRTTSIDDCDHSAPGNQPHSQEYTTFISALNLSASDHVCKRVINQGRSCIFNKQGLQNFGGIVQGRAVDYNFSKLSSGILPMFPIHNRKRAYYHYNAEQTATAILAAKQIQLPNSSITHVNRIHPLAWQAIVYLLDRGYRPISGQLAVGSVQSGYGTAIDALWIHSKRREWLLVELKKYEIGKYKKDFETQVQHQRQLAIQTILFAKQYPRIFVAHRKRSKCHKVRPILLLTHTKGLTLIPLKLTHLEWAWKWFDIVESG
jgi:hypothetical protein